MKAIARLARVQLIFAMLALVVIGAVTVLDVVLKYLFNAPIVGAYDLVESLLPVVIFHGLPTAILRRQVVVIDLLDHVVREPTRRLLVVAGDLATAIAFCTIGAALVAPAKLAFDYGDRKIELGLPLAVIWAVVILGMIGTILAAAANVVATVRTRGGIAP
jgi:TRAP-type C4-dicarboxylate transport system permease small subunit